MKRITCVQSGRTMIEIISVLVLMGFVAFLGMSLLHYFHAKQVARLIVDEAYANHTRMFLKTDKSNTNWISSLLPMGAGYTMYVRYDEQGNDLIKVEGINEYVCRQLLKEPGFSFMTTDNKTFDSCDSVNTIIISLSKKALGGEENSIENTEENINQSETGCTSVEDCGENYNGYCEAGHCISCGDNSYSDFYEKCIPTCTGKTSCNNATDVWCCNTNQNCGNNLEECSDKCTQNIDCGNSDRDYCDGSGHCQQCDEDMRYDSIQEECVCVERSCAEGVDKWCCPSDLACGRASGNRCMCETTDDCGENYNGYCDHITGRCIECTNDQYIEGTECINKCSSNSDCGTNSKCNIPDGQTRGKCVSSCASNRYRIEDGTCQGCDDGTRYKPASDYECQKCNITGKRVYYVDANGYCERSHCERLKFESGSSCQLCGSLSSTTPKNARECFFCDAFLTSNGKCQPCSVNAAITVSSVTNENDEEILSAKDVCEMCNETDFPREYVDGKCIPACLSTQVACQNTAGTNFWCCPQGTECVPEDENVKCRVTSTEGQCRYQFSVTSGNGPYDVIMDDEYSCPDGQYCFGKWDSTGNIQTGWVGDKTDKYIYGVCINMNHTIDSPTKDALNPWK